MLKKAMIYLGLGPDEHYDNYAAPPLRQGDRTAREQQVDSHGQQLSAMSGGAGVNDSMLGRTVQPLVVSTEHEHVHKLDNNRNTSGVLQKAVPRSSQPDSNFFGKPHVVSPTGFSDAEEIGNRFKSGQAVIVNLQVVTRELRRRLVDFSSGLCYGRNGKMDRVADQVYLLTPSEIDYTSRQTH